MNKVVLAIALLVMTVAFAASCWGGCMALWSASQ